MRLVRAGQLRARRARRGERGAALVEFSIVALVFLTATFGVLEFSRLLWTHNALSDAARRGARYAVTHPSADESAVKNVVVYGNAEGEGRALATGLTADKVSVSYVASPVTGVFGYPEGSVTVSIEEFDFNFVVPLPGTSFTLPDYRTTLPAESAGMIPPDIGPTPTPTASPSPTPTATPPPATPTPPPPTPTPSATPTPPPTPTPAPTPPACARGQNVSTGCRCVAPLRVNGAGKCQ